MKWTQLYLEQLAKGKAQGDFSPYSQGKWEQVDQYLQKVVGRLKDIHSINLKADFDHYGSGFSSYVHIYLYKRDNSGLSITENGNERTEDTQGLMIYLCRLAPYAVYAVYAVGNWSTTYQNEKWHAGFNHFIEADQVGSLPEGDWRNEMIAIKDILNQYRISFLDRADLEQVVDYPTFIPTILADPPYQVFDCFFYWAD